MQRRSVAPTDPRYGQLRARNNDSVKKSREKSRRERDETVLSMNELEAENEELSQRIQLLKDEYEQLQDLFKQHTGIAVDQLMASQGRSIDDSFSSALPASSLTNPSSMPIESFDHTSTQPLLTINTNDVRTTATTVASANIEFDAQNLDGALVLINGVQYRIVSLKKD